MSEIYLVATGEKLIGGHVRSIYFVIEEMLLQAEEEVIIAAYTMSGNLSEFFELLKKAASRGVKITVIINDLDSQPEDVRRNLRILSDEFPNVKTYSFDARKRRLHMKVVAVDRERALIGSANLTWKGMVENLELGVFIQGPLAEEVSKLLENLIASAGVSRVF